MTLSGNQKRKMRSASRLYAVQALFQMESSGQTVQVICREFETHRFGAVYEEGEFAEGDVTLFRSAGQPTADNLDVSAAITNLRSTCNDTGTRVYSEATFDVLARRSDTRGARRVELPFFATVLRGGSAVQSKRIGTVVVDFADGQERARGVGKTGAFVERSEATLAEDIREKITRKRKAGDPDAALDPLADPQVRAALNRATFEVLVGFQLTEQQLAYNATR